MLGVRIGTEQSSDLASNPCLRQTKNLLKGASIALANATHALCGYGRCRELPGV